HHLPEGRPPQRARVHAQAPPNSPRTPLHPFDPANPSCLPCIGNLFQLHPYTSRDLQTVDFDPFEFTAARMHHHSSNSAVAHEQIRTPANDKKRQAFASAKTNQPLKTVR